MLYNNRVIWSNSGSLVDLSIELNNFHSGTSQIDLETADYIYFGSDLPFNHRYLNVSTANTNSSVLSVDLWDGNQWRPAVDVIDQTTINGKAFAQSGVISFALEKGKQWAKDDSENITGLTTLKIYDLYWVRLKTSANMSLTTALKFVGNKFSKDEELGSLYPELALSATKTQFQTGKTDWEEQHLRAAESIIRDLKRREIMRSNAQILSWDLFSEASAHKVAEIIFNAFGDDYKDNRERALDYYTKALDLAAFNIDQNKNARLDENETLPTFTVIRR